MRSMAMAMMVADGWMDTRRKKEMMTKAMLDGQLACLCALSAIPGVDMGDDGHDNHDGHDHDGGGRGGD